MSSIETTLQSVEKALNTPAYPTGLPALVRENLSDMVTRLTYKNTPIRDRLPRKAGSGLAASWNVLTAMGVGTSPFTEGGTPTEDNTTYVRRSAIYKELGKTKSISDKMIAAGKSFTDLEAELTEVAMREVIQDEEQLIITGNATVTPTQFDGLRAIVTTNVVNDANNALGFRTALLDSGIETLVANYATFATAIYVGFGMKRAINQSLAGDVRVELTQGNQVSTGIEVGFYQSMIGKLPFIATFAIAGDTVSFAGNTVEDMYIVTETAQGDSVMYMEDLYNLGKGYLDRTGASVKFMVTEATVFVCKAEEFQVRIRNVRVK